MILNLWQQKETLSIINQNQIMAQGMKLSIKQKF